MHPFLHTTKNMVWIGLAWSPICIGIVVLYSLQAQIPAMESAVILVPGMIVQFFICLALWYVCKSTPIDRLNIFIILIKHCISAAITIATWLLIIYLYSKGLDWIFQSTTWGAQYINALPTLLIVGIFLYFLACFVYYILLATEKVQRAEQLALQQQLMATQAELRSLQTIISPHFLFNSLTALSTLTKSNPDRAQEMCLQLAEFLKYCMKYSQTYTATVENELDHIENYLSIEKIRLGERLRVEKKIDPRALNVPILPLTLLPLVENAIKHGIQECLSGGTLSITVNYRIEHLLIQVSNPYDARSQSHKHGGFGLRNLRQRIDAHYGKKAHLVFKKNTRTYIVRLTLPSSGVI